MVFEIPFVTTRGVLFSAVGVVWAGKEESGQSDSRQKEQQNEVTVVYCCSFLFPAFVLQMLKLPSLHR